MGIEVRRGGYMDFHHLEYALTIADLKSLNKAAQKLHLSPSALSQHITKLEREYNVALFERARGSWLLTEPGRILMKSFKETLFLQKEALSKIEHLKLSSSGGITLGLLHSWTVPLFSSIFPRFHEAYPDATVYPHREEAGTLLSELKNGTVDLAFLVGPENTIWDRYGFTKELLGKEHLVLVLPKNRVPEKYADGMSRTIDVRDLRDERFNLARSGSVFRQLEDELFLQAGFFPKIASDRIDMPSLELLTLAGFGPSFILANTIRPSGQAAFFQPVPSPFRPVYAIYRDNHVLQPAESCLISLAKEYYSVDPLDRTAHYSS